MRLSGLARGYGADLLVYGRMPLPAKRVDRPEVLVLTLRSITGRGESRGGRLDGRAVLTLSPE